MNIKYLLISALIMMVAFSCKKDEETETGNYLSGTLYASIPEFVENGDTIVIHPKGVWHPTAPIKNGVRVDSLGYYFNNPLTEVCDTFKPFPGIGITPEYKFAISKAKGKQVDTLGTFTAYIYAYAPDYYSSSAVAEFTIIREGYGPYCTLRGFKTYPEDGTLDIEGRSFRTTKIGNVEWMRENLATNTGRQYKNFKALKNIFGNYYSWTEAQTICPAGWTLPSNADWDSVMVKYPHVRDLMGDVRFNSDKDSERLWAYWTETGMPTDNSRLSILPTGYGTTSGNGYHYYEKGAKAVFWTSDSEEGEGSAVYIAEKQDRLYKSNFDKDNFVASVRCIKK